MTSSQKVPSSGRLSRSGSVLAIGSVAPQQQVTAAQTSKSDSKNVISGRSSIMVSDTGQPKSGVFSSPSGKGIISDNIAIPERRRGSPVSAKIVLLAVVTVLTLFIAVYFLLFHGGPQTHIQDHICRQFGAELINHFQTTASKFVNANISLEAIQIQSIASQLNALRTMSNEANEKLLFFSFQCQPFYLNVTFDSTKYALENNAVAALTSDSVTIDMFWEVDTGRHLQITTEVNKLGEIKVVDILKARAMFRRILDEIFENQTLITTVTAAMFHEMANPYTLPGNLLKSRCLSLTILKV